jgi:hypothetical protein
MRPNGPKVFPELASTLGVAGQVSAHGILERLGVIGSELVRCLPDEIGKLAAVGQLPENLVVDVSAQRQAVAGASQPKWRSQILKLSECLAAGN